MSWLLFGLLAAAQTVPNDMIEEVTGEEVPDVEVAAGPDRSRVPAVLAPELLELPGMQRLAVSDAITAYVVPVEGVRKVQVSVFQHRGAIDFEGHPTAAHEATGWLQDVATGGMDANEMAIAEDYWDADVYTDSGGLLRAGTHVAVPREDLSHGLDLLVDVLTDPKYPGRDVKQYRWERLRYYTQEAPNSPSTVASALQRNGWFPATSPYSSRPDLEAIDALRPGALRARHAEIAEQAPISVLVVGDVDPQAIVADLRTRLGDLGAPGEESDQPGFSPPGDRRILASDIPSSEQASVRLRIPAPLDDAPERDAFRAVAWAYGGHFLSRINRNLREEKGITYGARARYSADDKLGYFDIMVDVPADQVAVAVAEIEAELERVVAEGITPEEISAKSLEDIGGFNQVLQTTDSASGFYTALLLDGHSVADARARVEATAGLTPELTQQAAAAWLGPESARSWAIVGPRSVMEEKLADSGLPVEWIAPSDAVLGQFE